MDVLHVCGALRALASNLQLEIPLHALLAPPPSYRPPASQSPQLGPSLHAASARSAAARFLPALPAPHVLPFFACLPYSTRQYASLFNQPLNFDTSSVNDMPSMFAVRSVSLPPISSQAVPCMLLAPTHTLPSPIPHRPLCKPCVTRPASHP